MENLEEVMQLIDKYEVEDAWTIVGTFFQNNFAVADLLWGLHLAVKYHGDILAAFRTSTIERNIAAVCDMIEFDGDGKPKLRSNPNNRPLSDVDLAKIYSRVYASIEKYIAKSVPVKKTDVVSLKLQEIRVLHNINHTQDMSFSSNCTLRLTHITYPAVFGSVLDGSKGGWAIKVSIVAEKKTIYTTCHEMSSHGGTINILPSVQIQSNLIYTIQTEVTGHQFQWQPAFFPGKITVKSVQVAPDIQITFNGEYLSPIVAMNFLRDEE